DGCWRRHDLEIRQGLLRVTFRTAGAEQQQALAVRSDAEVVGVVAGRVLASDSIALAVRRFPPAGLDVPPVTRGTLKDDELIAECGDRTRAPAELDFLDESQLLRRLP